MSFWGSRMGAYLVEKDLRARFLPLAGDEVGRDAREILVDSNNILDRRSQLNRRNGLGLAPEQNLTFETIAGTTIPEF